MRWARCLLSPLIPLWRGAWGWRQGEREGNGIGGDTWGRCFEPSGWAWLGAVVVGVAGCSEDVTVGVKPTPASWRSGPTASVPAGTIPDGGRVQIEAVGSGRAWQFSYGGQDGILGTGDDLVSAGELTLPERAEVVIHLRSRDTIYVFSCPGLNLKEIAVPDLEFSLVFRTGGGGRYELAMDPMCGFPAAPGETMGALRVVSHPDYQSWLGSCYNRPH